jgi:predicted alpha/beta superfamily hydrolase
MAPDLDVEIRVHYPLGAGEMVLRADADWQRDIEPSAVSADGQVFHFHLALTRPYGYFKPLIHVGSSVHWSMGVNYLALADSPAPREIFPYFFADTACTVCPPREIDASETGTSYTYRVFHPPGYSENFLKRYPVLYMQDGQNLFFPDEAFQGRHWRIAETLSLLDSMNLVDKVIVVGVYPNEREENYTRPGYESYGRFLADALKPEIDRSFRTLPGPSTTAVMGSSLGGVVSFYLAWQYPGTFGMAACLSSTFGFRDDLKERVHDEPRRDLKLYIDSGWPRDNYEANRDMRALLLGRGYREGDDLLYLGFPEALHNEEHWAMRCHIPFQFLFGRARV